MLEATPHVHRLPRPTFANQGYHGSMGFAKLTAGGGATSHGISGISNTLALTNLGDPRRSFVCILGLGLSTWKWGTKPPRRIPFHMHMIFGRFALDEPRNVTRNVITSGVTRTGW